MNNAILVVDDDMALRETLEEILTDEGRDVATAEDGFDAVEQTNNAPFALVFMDLQMPGINGVEAFMRIKAIQPDCVVVMITGFAEEGLIKQALAEGAYTILHKPLVLEQLLEIVEQVIPTTSRCQKEKTSKNSLG